MLGEKQLIRCDKKGFESPPRRIDVSRATNSLDEFIRKLEQLLRELKNKA